eukprot:237564-Rhodomonas_salina.1
MASRKRHAKHVLWDRGNILALIAQARSAGVCQSASECLLHLFCHPAARCVTVRTIPMIPIDDPLVLGV